MSQPEVNKPVVAPRFRFDVLSYGPLLGLILLGILGAALNPDFATWGNISNVLTRTSLVGIIAIGATFVIISGGIDLSVGSLLALQSGVMILTLNFLVTTFGASVPTLLIGLAATVVLGFVVGLLHGLLITKGRIEAFIVTLGTAAIFRAVLTELAQGGTLTFQDSKLADLYSPVYYAAPLGIPVPILVFLGVALIAGLILNRTAFGRYVQAIGSNEQVARYATIRVDMVKTWVYVFQALCVTIATILYVPRLGSASNSTGLGFELEAIAAVIIGGTSLKGGNGKIFGTVIGAILLTTIGNVLNITSLISEYLNPAVQGVVIIIVAFLQRNRK
ncbi:ABC transporter permease [Deinococcus cellulosilyticus]|uniref:ABC transporter permease n=1 Tax=Deinococcus cellulosilyticus (strain DSM 18568 / NBRC 106333 / KACC 11606 / 5516J-15) TaxID=1223518 RepID=A0A511MVI8_DEIC1|nr:ABC transporter permease [Deinococcus cellulosilyticus]GEM44593.1 ABC transporter permease [Deinococcus cellulosilyticus NBRC 106333 = KACC 11606]